MSSNGSRILLKEIFRYAQNDKKNVILMQSRSISTPCHIEGEARNIS